MSKTHGDLGLSGPSSNTRPPVPEQCMENRNQLVHGSHSYAEICCGTADISSV